MAKKKTDQEQLFNEEVVHYIAKYPICFKNKSGNQYTCYRDKQKFEMITVHKDGENIRGCLIYGFSQQVIQSGERSYFTVLGINQTEIPSEEYEEMFNKFISTREEFFSNDDIKYKPEELTERQKNVKHKWPYAPNNNLKNNNDNDNDN